MGFTVSSGGWHWNIPDFAKQFRVIAFDNHCSSFVHPSTSSGRTGRALSSLGFYRSC
jgi:hypothetical protein